MINYIELGKRIRKKRKNLKLTQAKLAELSKIKSSNLSHIERGATKVSLPTLVKLANALNTTLDYLLYNSLENNINISIEQLNQLLENCSPQDLALILEMTKTTKSIIEQAKKQPKNDR